MAEENKGIYFTELTLQNVRCFGEEAVLKLSNDKGEWSRWNVILGDNGTGKTTLLQCLAGAEQINEQIPDKNDVLVWYSKISINQKAQFSIKPLNAKNKGSIVSVFITNINNKFKNHTSFGQGKVAPFVNTTSANNDYFSELFILGYGANRRISFQILSEKELESENSQTLFDDDAKLINAEDWLYQMDYSAAYAENEGNDQMRHAKKRRDLVFKIIPEILPDIDVVVIEIEGSPPRPVIKFQTPFGLLRIKELSYGYKTMVAWIVDVAARMFNKYPDSENPLEEPVVILVDEIDLHLHPKWQRQIFDFLETRFPKAQFIVTAHSPLIVQSAPKEANIIVLKKEQVGDEFIVKIDNDTKSVWNWRIDQIMASDLFGLDGLRNPEVERLMDERSILLRRDKESLSERERNRLEELNDLSHRLPTADKQEDIEAMEIIRQAADFIKKQQKQNDSDKK